MTQDDKDSGTTLPPLLSCGECGARRQHVDVRIHEPGLGCRFRHAREEEIRVGFIPLTDCSSVVMAAVKKFDEKYGIKIIPSKESSWASVRDKLVSGELDAAHVLYGMLYGLQLGVSGPQHEMAMLMSLNQNGQAITLSEQLKQAGVTDAASLQKVVQASAKGTYTFAQTFPTGTHAMWLYYWLANAGIHPFNDVRNVVVPPPQMVMNMKIGNMSGFAWGNPEPARDSGRHWFHCCHLTGNLAGSSGKSARHNLCLGD